MLIDLKSTLDRSELGRLLMDSHRNDILLVEQIDRLTRLSNSDWMTLKIYPFLTTQLNLLTVFLLPLLLKPQYKEKSKQ